MPTEISLREALEALEADDHTVWNADRILAGLEDYPPDQREDIAKSVHRAYERTFADVPGHEPVRHVVVVRREIEEAAKPEPVLPKPARRPKPVQAVGAPLPKRPEYPKRPGKGASPEAWSAWRGALDEYYEASAEWESSLAFR